MTDHKYHDRPGYHHYDDEQDQTLYDMIRSLIEKGAMFGEVDAIFEVLADQLPEPTRGAMYEIKVHAENDSARSGYGGGKL